MNVTTEINTKRNSMGGSGSSRQEYLSPNKSLNLSTAGNSINTAKPQLATAIPVEIKMQDSVGLFGAENRYIKLDLDIQSSSSVFDNIEVPENTYFPVWTFNENGVENDYFTAEMNFLLDLASNNGFQQATVSGDLSQYQRPVISVELFNLKTGNKYVDNWLDIQLYGPNKQPTETDKIYTDLGSDIYIGFHARNTKRLPYNIRIEIGVEYVEFAEMTNAQQRAFV